jgi:ABC-type Zn uptake system ZnuABC Zn-binding protein ZnuA
VAGEVIELTILIEPGQDSHSYEPSSGDLTAVSDAHVIFINGWGLEEGLVDDLETISENGVLVPVSAGITPILLGKSEHQEHEEEEGKDEEHKHSGPDPHVWQDPHQVVFWVENISQVLQTLDPANAGSYEKNAAAYLVELQSLIDYYDQQVAAIPAENRVMVTNHNALGYFAAAYDFEIVGTVLSGASTLSEPSANELAELVEVMKVEGVCAIFTEISANDRLAEAVAQELSACDEVEVVLLYTEAVGRAGSGADSYIGMMRQNIEAIANALN